MADDTGTTVAPSDTAALDEAKAAAPAPAAAVPDDKATDTKPDDKPAAKAAPASSGRSVGLHR